MGPAPRPTIHHLQLLPQAPHPHTQVARDTTLSMRFTSLFTFLSFAVVALAMPHIARKDDSLSQAPDIARTLSDELASLLAKTRESAFLQESKQIS